jgi:hypothetical protein
MYHLQLNAPRVATSNAQYLMVRDCAMEGRTCVVPNAPRLIETHSLWCPAIPSLSNSSHVPALTYTVLKGYWHIRKTSSQPGLRLHRRCGGRKLREARSIHTIRQTIMYRRSTDIELVCKWHRGC